MASTPHIKYINRHYQVLPNKNNIRDSNNFDPYRSYPTKVSIIIHVENGWKWPTYSTISRWFPYRKPEILRGSAGALFGGLGLVQAQFQDEAGRPEAAGGFGGEPTGYSMVIQWL